MQRRSQIPVQEAERSYDVDVYLMRVTAVLDHWLEAGTVTPLDAVDDALTRLHPDLHGSCTGRAAWSDRKTAVRTTVTAAPSPGIRQ